MRILIDTTPLISPKSGIGHYTSKISSALLSDNDFETSFFTSNCFHKNLNNIHAKKENFFLRQLNKNISINHLIRNIRIKNYIEDNNVEIFHQPNFITYDLAIKNISTVHDLAWMHYPQFFHKSELKYFELYFEKSLKYSNKIIVHSNFIKNELCKLFNIPEDQIHVVYEDLRNNLKKLDENGCQEFLNNFKLKFKGFFLVINSLELRKNFDFILNIYQKLDNSIKEKFPLVIFGMKGRHANEILNKIQNIENCKYFGYLDDNLLNQCLSSAKIFFYPSIYEGFGISPLEAMASGTPVIASRIKSSIEILKDNAVLIDLDDEIKWINKINLVIKDKNFFDERVQKGINYATNFKKGNTVKQILDIYKKI